MKTTLRTPRVALSVGALAMMIAVASGGCDDDPPRLATVSTAIEEGVAPEPNTEEVLALEDAEVRAAFDAYVASITGPLAPEAEEAAIEGLRALPAERLVSELARAFDESTLVMSKWLIMFALAKVPAPETLSFASQFLQSTVYDEYEDYVAATGIEDMGEDVIRTLRVVYEALTIVSRCVSADVPDASDLLLSVALDHDFSPVRKAAIHEIEMLGDAGLATALREAIRPEDEVHLNPKIMPHAELIQLDPNDPAFDDSDEPELPE